MAYNPADQYVTPTGIKQYENIFGEDRDGNPIAGGGFFGGDPFGSVRDAWNFQRLGYGVLPPSQGLQDIMGDSQNRYNNWANDWKSWNATDFIDPLTGQVRKSALTQTGQRLGQDYGVRRDPRTGQTAPLWNSDIVQGLNAAMQYGKSNPYLDPRNQIGGFRDTMASSPYAQPDVSQYTKALQYVLGGPEKADAYGQRGLQQAAYINGLPGSDFDKYGSQQISDIAGLNQLNDFDQYGKQQINDISGLNQLTNFDQYGDQQIAGIAGLNQLTNFGQFGDQQISDISGLNQLTDFDQYGRAGVEQTRDLNDVNVRQLTRNIDREAQDTLANQLPETMQAMEAAGLGRSGAGQLALMNNQNQILEQANRDKQRTLADFADRGANRTASAINLATQQGFAGLGQKHNSLAQAMSDRAQMGFQGLGQEYGQLAGAMNSRAQMGFQGLSQEYGQLAGAMNNRAQMGFQGQGQEYGQLAQAMSDRAQMGYGGMGQKFGALQNAAAQGTGIGAQGYENYANRMGQGIMTGLGEQYATNEANRAAERGLWAQGMQNENQRYGWDTGNYLQAMQAAGQFQLGSLDAERMGQSQAQQDWMGLQAQRDQFRGSRMDEYLNLSERDRALQQERINQMIQAGYLPLNLMQTITTGVQGNAGSNGAQTAPWWQGAAGGLANGVGQGVGSWFGDYMGKNF